MDEAAVKDEGFNAAEFANSTFKMIDEGLPEAEVTLLCDNVFLVHKKLSNFLRLFHEES